MATDSIPIPKPPGLPLLGNLFDIDRTNTWWSLKQLAEKYGEIFQIQVLGKTIVFVASAALTEELCDETRFRKLVSGPIVEIRYAVHDSLFTAYDDEPSWPIHHRIIAPELAPDQIALQFADMRDCTSELIEKWVRLDPATNTIQPLLDLNRLNLEATTLSLFGKKLDCINASKPHPMLAGMEISTSEAVQRPTRPKLLTWLFHGSKLKNATAVMRSYAQDLVDHRAAFPTDKQDLLAALQHGKDPKTGEGLTPSQVLDEIVTMPIGSSTAPCSLASMIHYLTLNPHVVAAARSELDRVLGDGPLEHHHLAKLSYIGGIVRETMRLANPAPGFNIEPVPTGSTAPVLLQGGRYQVAHNQAMIVVLAGVNRDPAVFDRPLEFRPERMMGDEFARLPSGVKKWFGNGKRECIGKHWAWDFLMTVTAKLIHELDFEAVEGGYEMKQDGWFNVRPVEFRCKVRSRGA